MAQIPTNEELHKELREMIGKLGAFMDKYSESIAEQIGPDIDKELNEIWIEIGKIMRKFDVIT